MAAQPLTDERWTGLPLLACHMDPGLYRIEVATPMLVIRDDVGTEVEVLSAQGGRRCFRQAPLRFDVFSAGLLMNATSDRVDTRSLVVALPNDWLPTDDEATGRRLLLRPRFQFADAPLRRLVGRLSAHHRGGEPLGADYNRAVSRFIVDRVARIQWSEDARGLGAPGLDPEACRLVESLVDADLQEPPTVATLAAKVGMGRGRFARAFRISFQATPHQYVMRQRLERASRLLRDTDAPLATIAIDTGFASHSHFATVFRACTGTTPGDFRRASVPRRPEAPTSRDA